MIRWLDLAENARDGRSSSLMLTSGRVIGKCCPPSPTKLTTISNLFNCGEFHLLIEFRIEIRNFCEEYFSRIVRGLINIDEMIFKFISVWDQRVIHWCLKIINSNKLQIGRKFVQVERIRRFRFRYSLIWRMQIIQNFPIFYIFSIFPHGNSIGKLGEYFYATSYRILLFCSINIVIKTRGLIKFRNNNTTERSWRNAC